MMASKALRLLSLLPRHPLEFYDRLTTVLEVRLEGLWTQTPTYLPAQWEELVQGLERCLKVELDAFLAESALSSIECETRRGIENIRHKAPFRLSHNAEFALARICYLVCRAMKPAVVLETGVAYGVNSAFVLKALEQNRTGTLHSVDLPPLGRDADRFVGALIPQPLRNRWRLYRGISKRLLPKLLPQLGQVDVFIHDSLHTYRNMRREFQTVLPYLAPRAVVIADDVEGNRAFYEWVMRTQPAFWATVKQGEKERFLGLGVILSGPP